MDSDTDLPLVSICIPTFNRHDLLRVALESCVAQSYKHFEIIVGDDSTDDRSQALIAEFQAKYPGKIRYMRNIPSLGQAENVNSLFKSATGSRLVLLHDDDVLLPIALQDLSACWVRWPSLVAAFGKQYIMNMRGEILLKESEQLNKFYARTTESAGRVVPGLAGIKQMFPNDGYMVLTERARAIGFRPFDSVGEACDFDFAMRYCADEAEVWFHDSYTTAYRLSDDGISRSSITAPYVYRILNQYWEQEKGGLAPEVERALRKAIENSAPFAVSGHARMGQGLKALRILVSSDYVLRERFRARFLKHGALTVFALVAGSAGAKVIIVAQKWYEGFKKPNRISG